MLEVKDVNVSYSQMLALKNVTLTVPQKGISLVLGANGAGKTTLLNTIAGLRKPASGTISYDGKDITSLSPQKIAREGIILVPSERAVFGKLSVRDNLEVAAGKYREIEIEKCYDLFPELKKKKNQTAATLSGGEQKMLAISIGLVRSPKLLMLDEPSSGLGPIVVRRLYQSFKSLLELGITLLIAEQTVPLVSNVARVYVLDNGSIALTGDGKLLADSRVKQTYMGA